jgi:hypothetical protein
MNRFNLNINRKNFENRVLEIQNNEGNNVLIVNTIDKKIQHSNIYKSFLEICKEYNVEFNFFQKENEFIITIITNGYESQSMSYADKNKDISIDLASILYRELSIQIRNKDFIQKINLKG